MEIYLSTIVTAILLFFAGLWLKNFLPNYFNEKGKLLAQKEDIADITEKIEKVKTEFTQDTEFLKSSLQRLIDLETSHRTEERNSIISFYTKYNEWLYALLEINYGAYNRLNVKELMEKRIYVEKFYGECSIAQSKVRLLVKDDEILTLSGQLYFNLLEFKGWFNQKLLALQHNIDNHIFLNEEFIPLIQKIDDNRERVKQIGEEEMELKKQYKELVNNFLADRLIEYKKIILIDTLFTEKVKAYLTK